MSKLLNSASKSGNVKTEYIDDMTVCFVSGIRVYYNDVKKAYDLNVWHGNVNPFLHDAEVCLKRLCDLSDKDPGLLIKWARDGLISLTPDGRIESVKCSVRGIDDTFRIKADGHYINDNDSGDAWKKFLFDNYETICRMLVDGICTEYENWLTDSVNIYKNKDAKVLLSVSLDPWMFQSSFNTINEYSDDKFLHMCKKDHAGIGFYIYAGEEDAHCWRFNDSLNCTQEFTVSVPKDLSNLLRRIIE